MANLRALVSVMLNLFLVTVYQYLQLQSQNMVYMTLAVIIYTRYVQMTEMENLSAMATMYRELDDWYIRPRDRSWYENWVVPVADPREFRRTFRMSADLMGYLVTHLTPRLQGKDTNFKKAMTTHHKVSICLFYLASGETLPNLSQRFGIGISTAWYAVHETAEAIVDTFLSSVIQFPADPADVQRHKETFYQLGGIPDVVAAGDGVHIPILMPGNAIREDYIDKDHTASLGFQVFCSPDCKILDVFGPWPGCVNDIRIFQNSGVHARGEAGQLFPPGEHGFVVMDSIYSLSKWVMVPYPFDESSDHRKRRFNLRHSRTRVVAEHTFGMLKGRFRCLLKRLDCNVKYATKIIIACMILHNICLANGDVFDEAWLGGDGGAAALPIAIRNPDRDYGEMPNVAWATDPAAIREQIADLLMQADDDAMDIDG